jgi:Spy/CpxP family protein refolding chaperone
MATWWKIGGITAAAALVLVGAGAWAFVGGHGGGRHGIMKRVVSAMIDEALDGARVTPEQRQTIHGARDRAFAAVEEHRRVGGDRLGELLALFEAEQVDPGALQALRERHEAEHRRIADAIGQAVRDAHAVLTPEQRRAVADYVRAHHRRHHAP